MLYRCDLKPEYLKTYLIAMAADRHAVDAGDGVTEYWAPGGVLVAITIQREGLPSPMVYTSTNPLALLDSCRSMPAAEHEEAS